MPKMQVDIAGISLKNPVMSASGTFGYGVEFASLVDLNHLGGIIVKGLSLTPSAGNPPPRIVETPCGMLNAIGLENIGVEAFIDKKLPRLAKLSTPVIANIYGETMEAYAELADRLDSIEAVTGIEVNISCPNVDAGGIAFGVDPVLAGQVVTKIRNRTGKLVIVKLSPNVTDITEMARAVVDAGADAVSLINTITGMSIDIESKRPILANVIGGLSGPAIRPVALRMVWQVACAVEVPVIGIGGIMTAEDALAFIIAGATAVQIGTANFVDPGACVTIIEGIKTYLEEKGIRDIKELIGAIVT
jgi:dihydroorotate dehydrogenase (NAD+) catalytic subunit